MYKITITLLKALSTIFSILLCIAVLGGKISHATLFTVLALYSDYRADKLKNEYGK